MTSTFDTIKKSIYIRSKELIPICTFALAGFVIGHIILRVVMAFDNSPDPTSFEVGTVMSTFFVFFSSLAGATNYCKHINYAISMEKRRMDILTSHLLIALVKGVIATSLIYIFHSLERYVCATTYSKFPQEVDFDKIFTLKSFFLIWGFLVTIEVFMGALQTRFGPKVFLLIWLICMSTPIISSSIIKAKKQTSDSMQARFGQFLIDLYNNVDFNVVLTVSGVVIILLIISPYVFLRKHRVTL